MSRPGPWPRRGLAAVLALVVVGGVPAACAAGDARKQSTMAETKTAVGKISRVETPDGADGSLVLENGTRVTLPHKSPLYDHWKVWLLERQTAGKPVYVEYDGSAAQRILHTIEWKVEGLGAAPDGDRLRVILLMKPSTYWLKASRPEYAAWRDLLAEAHKSQEPLLLVTQPETYEVLYVAKLK
jgi:hypothetical protein